MSAIRRLHHKYSTLFRKLQENRVESAKRDGIEWQRTPKECLIRGALPFSECNERMSFVAIQRPMGAYAILLR